jgi:uncharacterized membrane protein
MSKLDDLMKNRPFKISFLVSFLVCFLGVMNGFEHTIISALVVMLGVAIGFSGAMTFRRWRGDFRK